jgi:hypothetical protein
MTATAISAVQQKTFSGQVARVFDTKLKETPASFNSVLINWGDGQTTPGQIVGPIVFPGTFQVTGSHVYAKAGSYSTMITVSTISGANASAIGSASVMAPPFPVSVNTITSSPGTTLNDLTVATFIAPSSASLPPDGYGAIIDWGDGQTSAGTIEGTSEAATVVGSHTYATAGTFTTSVTVSAPNGDTSTGVGAADITAPSPYSSTSVYIVTPVSQVFSGIVAKFTDTNTSDPASNFTASIDWGDGGTTPATVTGSNGSFAVHGTYTYQTPGTYAVTVTVADQTGSSFTVTNTASVTTTGGPGAPVTLTGSLDASITNGPHSASGFTNTNRPTFSGMTTPFGIVQLYGRHFNADAQIPLGQAVATSSGQWTFTSGPLAVGTWIITAIATPPGGYPGNVVTLTNQNGGDLLYVDLTPRLVRWLSHGQKPVPHRQMSRPPKPRHPKIIEGPSQVGLARPARLADQLHLR